MAPQKRTISHRRIAVVTGTRAEYGLLRSTLKALNEKETVELQLIVTGMHLLKRYGYTMKLVQEDEIPIAAEVPVMEERDNDPKAMANIVSRGIAEMSKVFEKLNPRAVLLLGDRVEIFAAGVAAALTGRVVAHIHGGDVTRGGYDESMRHALTKFSHLHFAATSGARARILRMGEQPKDVYLVGAPGVDELLHAERALPEELEKTYGVKAGEYILLLQHSVSTTPDQTKKQIDTTLQALSKVARPVIALYPNNDTGGEIIVEALEKAKLGMEKFKLFPSLPRRDFIGLMEHAGAMCGNSSSGIIEAGYFGTPVIDLGERQEGRECGENVRRAPHDASVIEIYLRRCFEDPKFIEKCKNARQPYGDGQAGQKIADVLAEHPLPPSMIRKTFYS